MLRKRALPSAALPIRRSSTSNSSGGMILSLFYQGQEMRLADDAGIGRDRFIERLFDAGIGCSVHYIPLHLHPYWRDRYALQPGQFPHSQHAYERMLSLPIYTRMSDDDVMRVAQAVRAALR